MDDHFTPGGISHNDMYITRLPSPPIIRVVPVSWHQKFSFMDAKILAQDAPDFLNEIDWTPFQYPPPAEDWTYAERRQAQLVLPFLALGPLSIIKDLDYLREKGITAIVAIRHKHGGFVTNATSAHLTQAATLGIQVHTFDVADPQGLVAVFSEANKIINSHLSSQKARHLDAEDGRNPPGVVLVACESGNQRAPAVVAAYMMDVLHQDFITAIQYVNCRRFCTDINEPLKRALQAYQDVIQAKRDVFGTSPSYKDSQLDVTLPRSSCKRAWEQSSDDGLDDRVEHSVMEGISSSSLDDRFFAPFGE